MLLVSKYFTLKRKIREIFLMICSYSGHCKEIKQYKNNTVVLWGIPEYGNLGDQAITYAELEFIKQVLPKQNIITIPENKCCEYIYPMRKMAQQKHCIFISNGGGNMGSLYKYQESIRQMLIKNIKNCKIIVFPQSVDYIYGSNTHRKAQKIYNKNSNISMFARDIVSFEKMTKLFPKCKIKLCPDIVTFLDRRYIENLSEKKGILCCLREDKEVNENSKNMVEKILTYIGKDNCECIDTYGQQYVREFFEQEGQIEYFWKRIKTAKLVVTDRLHGMIFSMINDTPCIALDNSTGKVLSFYDSWLMQSKGIKVYNNNLNEIKEFIDECLYSNLQVNSYVDLKEKFKELAWELAKSCEEELEQ